MSAADEHHEYESPRGSRYPNQPCAVCGQGRGAGVHR